jgi:hypothetical protein
MDFRRNDYRPAKLPHFLHLATYREHSHAVTNWTRLNQMRPAGISLSDGARYLVVGQD